MIKALAFDFDGLILDTEGPIFQSWQELFESYGAQLTLEEWQIVIGSAEGTSTFFAALDERLGEPLDLDTLAPRRLQRELQLVARQPILPGVMDYLQEARRRGLRLGVASSSDCAWVTGHLQRLRLKEYFACILGSDDVPRTKPDPELFLKVVDCLGVSPQQAIAFEDSPNGVLAAKRAGLYCVAVPNPLTRQLDLGAADLLLDSLADLPLGELIDRVEKELSANLR